MLIAGGTGDRPGVGRVGREGAGGLGRLLGGGGWLSDWSSYCTGGGRGVCTASGGINETEMGIKIRVG